jgi:hypothetical protein
MDDYMLTTVKMRGDELMREARQSRRAAGARRAAPTAGHEMLTTADLIASQPPRP